MVRWNGIKRCAAVLLAVLLLMSTPALAIPWPTSEPIATVDELNAWYGKGGSCILMAELVVTDTLRLAAEQGGDIDGQNFGIRVTSGGHLIVDSINTTIFGVHADESPLIYVEAGGRLTMTQGWLFGLWGNYMAKTIVLEPGATLTWDASFHVEGGVWIGDELQPKPGTEPTPTPTPTPEPTPTSTPMPTQTPPPETKPEPTEINTAEDLLVWYTQAVALGGAASCELKANLFLVDEMILGLPKAQTRATAGKLYIDADSFRITIGSGGSLTMDNPDLTIAGYFRMLQVQYGGGLILNRGKLTTEGSMDGAETDALLVSPGGSLTQAAGFRVVGTVENQGNQPADTLEIVRLWCDEQPQLPVGADVVVALPKRAKALVNLPDSLQQVLLPIPEWDISAVKSDVAGQYTVIGTIPESELIRLNLENPRGLTVSMEIAFYSDGPITTLQGKIFKLTNNDEMTVELRLPRIPIEASALYIERQLPDDTWVRVRHTEGENFIFMLHLNEDHHYVAFRLPVDYGVTRIRVVVEDSGFAGESNVIGLTPPDVIAPPPETGDGDYNDDWDDGSGEGNRGGGGQGESKREKPTEPEPTPTAESIPAVEPEPTEDIQTEVMPTQTAMQVETVSPSIAPTQPPFRPVKNSSVPALAQPEETAPPSPDEPAALQPVPTAEKNDIKSVPLPEGSSAPTPEPSHQAEPTVSKGVVAVAIATAMVTGGLALASYFTRKRKP